VNPFSFCRDCLIVGIGNSLTSLLAGIPIFAVLGYMAKELGVPVSEAVHSGLLKLCCCALIFIFRILTSVMCKQKLVC